MLAGVTTGSFAQTARDESVQQRPRPDFDPEGLYFDDLVDGLGRAVGLVRRDQPRSDTTSSVIIYPRLLLGTYYDDNVLRSPSGKRGDFAHTVRASLDINSARDEHGVEFGGYAEHGYFDRFVSENYQQYGGYAGGFLVPTDETRLGTRFSYEQLRQPREDIGAATAQSRPTIYHLMTGSVKGEYQDADWLLVPSIGFKRYTYEPNQPVVLGSEFDRNEYTAAFRVGHAVNSGSAVFIEPQVNKRSYDLAVSTDDGFRHDSSGYQVLAGARLDFSSVTYAEFAGGWLHQSYVDPAFKSLSGPALLATGVWNPRDWITATLEAGRQVSESTIAGVSGIEVTYVQGTLDYEIDYDWMATANVGYTTADYRDTALARAIFSTAESRSDSRGRRLTAVRTLRG